MAEDTNQDNESLEGEGVGDGETAVEEKDEAVVEEKGSRGLSALPRPDPLSQGAGTAVTGRVDQSVPAGSGIAIRVPVEGQLHQRHRILPREAG